MAQRSDHAIVIGASMGGLLAARAVAEHYDQVTIIERDELPEAPEPRKGVPQGQHTHALHAWGLEGLEQLFPGLTGSFSRKGLSAAMAPQISSGTATAPACATHRAG
jgi:2-polyprenyl-6-methoxyphenol hydroxylase-like FAD-dependent oxidoreductase